MTNQLNQRSFKIYIYKILADVHPETGIAAQALNTVDAFIRILSTKLSETSRNLTIQRDLKTIEEKDVLAAAEILLGGELSTQAKDYCAKALQKYSSFEYTEDTPKVQREVKAGLVTSISLIERFLRENSTLRVSDKCAICLTAIVEYIISELLEFAGNNARDVKRVRINNRHLGLAVMEDDELNTFFRKLGVAIPGAGVVPHIDERLIERQKNKNKSRPKNRTRRSPDDDSDAKVSHKWRPGTVAIRNIQKAQKSGERVLAVSQFERTVRHFSKDGVMFAEGVIITLQNFLEDKTVEMFKKVNGLALHSGRETLQDSDFMLYNSLFDINVDMSKKIPEDIGGSGIRKLAFRAGVLRMGSEAWKYGRAYVCYMTEKIVNTLMVLLEHQNRRMVTLKILVDSLTFYGYFLSIVPIKSRIT